MNIFNTQLPEHWEYTTLGDVCLRGGGLIQTGPFGSQLHASDYVPFGVPSIMPVNIGDNQIVTHGIARISEVDAERLSRYKVKTGDIVYSRRGDVERCSLVREEQDSWLCGTGCLMIRLGDNVTDPRFASFYLKHPAVKEWILRHALGATMPNLNTSIMQSVPFILPPLPTQHAIARILGSLDDKIELNRQMNETLEATARAIFQSWFVDFDPVRAKAEGRQPAGMDAEMAALFPSELVEVAGREVPKGWGVEPIYEIADVIYGAPFSSKLFNNEKRGLPLIRIRDLSTQNPEIYTDEEQLRGEKVQPGDIVVGMDGEFNVHIWTGPISWLNQRVCKFVPKRPNSTLFVKLTIVKPIQFFERSKVGTTIIHLGKSDIDTFRVLIPSKDILAKFGEITEPLNQKIISNAIESRTLAQIRDVLLPKLMSGEIIVDTNFE